MTSALRLVVFDVDGTLVDSQADILAAMGYAFDRVGMGMPERSKVLGIVGLSLDVAVARLAPELERGQHDQMVDFYKEAYVDLRHKNGAAHSSPLYAGAVDALEALHAMPDVLLGVATGKSRRGLDKLLEAHDLHRFFITQQVSDHHPSKPHPSMLMAAMSETGVEPKDAVMVGDTSFDMQMAQAAGITGIGVSWGYHEVSALEGAVTVLEGFQDLHGALNRLWETVS
ncbi:HAD-IA family hydrolase [uncultured Roseovarius sp.]|uniref:HAD-IA family hydrolase n=1 Tax=uncultured Roseovarius sp. TaxID=293344 RepID=UPI0025EDB4E2|nr:HAD-IA family hydrolase [uncultured Roseovarius sp.]